MSCAAFEDMHLKSLSPARRCFACHSLGGFSALGTVSDIQPNSSLVDIVFYCGLTIQHAVERDEQGRSNDTVNPNHVGKTLDDAALREVVNTVLNGKDCFLEIVDFNVKVRQQFFISLCAY